MKMNLFVLISLMTWSHLAIAQDPIVGKWRTIDDETAKPRSIVEIYKKENLYYGKVIEMFLTPEEDPDPVCDDCDRSDPRYMKKVMGMEILKGAKRDGEEYVGGEILDPKNGKVYSCKLWLEEGNLKLRGYVAFFYRTQTWQKYE
ncbi:DUF2147 domain-containing protein [Reichenbachiella carrageenanivorans]|uniref:DUF2147 domain-containing protein n=1 Tax=Reichenbachiella carrageenanivorans TaxID=2979869 RepID=A0ABY6D1Q6_9BACT|nr:DUF2147 domain-containing protein [Reichenbachiella carrageenanivorans]UXX80099.1 DUF2147 domain-containing protein [Reichenbachiella carrageenanivorans]